MTQASGQPSEADSINALFSTDRDRGAESAAPAPEAAPPVQQDFPAEQAAQPAPAASEGQATEPPRLVPLSELQSERRKRQDYERQAQEAEARARAYEQMVQNFQRQQTAQPLHQQQAPRPQAPDPLVDPNGFQSWVDSRVEERVAQVQQQMHGQFLNRSKYDAAQTYGLQTVQQAEQAAVQNGAAAYFAAQPDPYGALMGWWNQSRVLHEVGGDLTAYQERLRKEGAEAALAKLKQGNTGQPQQRFPTTLADQTAASAQMGAVPQSGAGMINAMFAPDRNRKVF